MAPFTVQLGLLEFSGKIGCVRVYRARIKKKKKKKKTQAHLFRGLSAQLLLIVLLVGLDGRLLTLFSLWMGYIVARPTCSVTQTLNEVSICLGFRDM